MSRIQNTARGGYNIYNIAIDFLSIFKMEQQAAAEEKVFRS
jgi:hypothetical protein